MIGSSGFDQMIPIQEGNNMKKRVAILLAVVLTLALAACKKPVNVNWSRTGPVEDADGNYLTVAASEDEENPGWMVWCMLGEETHGWYIQQEGEALVFDEESPAQVIRFNLSDAGSCQFGARADEGWQFVKWIMNGKDFSADEEIAVEITESKSLVAVFEPIG